MTQAPPAGVLYVVGTPIGNLDDLSMRAARTLATVDLIAAEDTRAAQVLMRAVGSLLAGGTDSGRAPRILSLFEGNEAERSESLVAELLAGRQVALISEAGMPIVSDPGARLVRAVIAAGVRIVVVPGPNAGLAALVASGLGTGPFLFLGFPPRETGERQALFGSMRTQTATLIFYEAPDRLAATCRDLVAAFGPDRRASLGRELTKLFEEHVRGTVAELAARYAEVAPRGECTLIVEGAPLGETPTQDLTALMRAALAEGLGPKDAAARLVAVTGKPRRQLYQLALSLAREGAEEA